jgi:hypothetical protein
MGESEWELMVDLDEGDSEAEEMNEKETKRLSYDPTLSKLLAANNDFIECETGFIVDEKYLKL